MNIDKEIREAIDKNLTKEVGERLAERLRQADELEKKVKELSEQATKGDAYIKELQKTNNELQSKLINIDTRENTVKNREDKVGEDERNFKVKESELKAACAEQKVLLMEKMMERVFYSPVYRSTTMKSVPSVDQFGGTRYNTETSSTEHTPDKP